MSLFVFLTPGFHLLAVRGSRPCLGRFPPASAAVRPAPPVHRSGLWVAIR